jgi:hypothetical protein
MFLSTDAKTKIEPKTLNFGFPVTKAFLNSLKMSFIGW